MSFIHNNTDKHSPIKNASSYISSNLNNKHLAKTAFKITQVIALILIVIAATLLGCNLIGLGVGVALVVLGAITLTAGAISILVKNIKRSIKEKKALETEKQLEQATNIAEEKSERALRFRERYNVIDNSYINQEKNLKEKKNTLVILKNTLESNIQKLTESEKILSSEITEEQSSLQEKKVTLQAKFTKEEANIEPDEKKLQILKGDLQQAKVKKLQLTDQFNAIKHNISERSSANQLKQNIKQLEQQTLNLNEQIKIQQDKQLELSKRESHLNNESLQLNREQVFLDSKISTHRKIADALETDIKMLKEISAIKTSIETSLEDLQEFLTNINNLKQYKAFSVIEKNIYEKLVTIEEQLSLIISTQHDNLSSIDLDISPTNLDQLSLDIDYQIK